MQKVAGVILCGENVIPSEDPPKCCPSEWRDVNFLIAAGYKALSTSAEFFDPKAMQLQTALAICFLRPTSGT